MSRRRVVGTGLACLEGWRGEVLLNLRYHVSLLMGNSFSVLSLFLAISGVFLVRSCKNPVFATAAFSFKGLSESEGLQKNTI